MSSPGEIAHVSDTALMVAACRALESASSDGFVRDPFALQLAGLRGMELLRSLPEPQYMTFDVGVRSRFMDELILETLASRPIATVLSMGCGLDSRPWRLELPPGLRWIEADFAGILDYKDAVLSSEAPRCRRERFAADLNDPAQRRALFAAAGPAAALMITEGLLMYLPSQSVEALAVESAQLGGITCWIADITTAALEKAINRGTPQSVRQLRAADALDGERILDTLRRHHWVSEACRSCITDMAFANTRAQRLFSYRPLPSGSSLSADDPTGVHRFVRTVVPNSRARGL